MAKQILTLSGLIAVVLLVRAIFKNRVPKRMLYCLWLVVLLKLCLPGTLVSLPVLPAEEVTAPVQAVQNAPVSVQPTTPTQTAPQPETQEPVTKPAVQQAAAPAAKPLTTAQILLIVWAAGSGLLGLWLISTWAVFTVRLHKSRKFLGKRGRTNIYVSKCIKSPCLAGVLPAVYLTEDVLQTDEAELILRHELTHLHHLDFLWSFCRAAAVSVYWWNPFIWLAAIFSKRDAELACDEAVAEDLAPEQRIAYARAILAQAPRKKAALSLAGPPVRERILFLTKKQKTSVLCIVLALALTVTATGCSFAELTQQKSSEITLPDHSANSSSEATPPAADSTLPVMNTVELIGFVADSQTPWIELYESMDSKEPLAKVPYDLIAALPGCDRNRETFPFGYLDSITFYYGEIGTFCWCVAALPPAAGTGSANVCTSPDSGETWSISDPNALYTGTVIGAGFASETVGFISYRYFFDNGPEIARTLDGGKTWARLELDIPAEYAQYNMQPQNPTFSGNDGSYPIILLDKDGNERTTTLQTHDGGMTWTWPTPGDDAPSAALSTPAAILDGSTDLSAMSLDALGKLLDELNALRPEGETAQNEKWAAVSAVKTELVDRAKESGYSYREPVTFETLNEMIGYRLMNNEILMKAFPDDDAQMEACRKENAAIEAFRATLPENGSDEEAYAYWKTYWEDVLQQEAPSYFVPSLSQTDFETHMLALSSGKTAEELTIDTFPDVLAQDAALESFLRDLPERAAFYCANDLIEKMWYGADGNEPYTPDFALTALGRLYVLSMQYLMETYNHSTGQLAAILSHELTPEDWLYQFWGEVGLAFAGQAYTMDGIYYDEHPIEKQCMTALLRSPKRLLTATLFDYASPVDSERIEDDRFSLYEFLAEGRESDHLRIEPAGTTREDLLAACTEDAHWEVEGGTDTTVLHITPESGQALRLVYSRNTN